MTYLFNYGTLYFNVINVAMDISMDCLLVLLEGAEFQSLPYIQSKKTELTVNINKT